MGKLVEAQRLEQRTRFDLEMLAEVGHCKGIENYSRHLSGSAPGEPPATLTDYLPRDALMFLDESHVLIGQFGGMYNGDRVRKTTLVEYGFRLPSALDNRPLKFEEFEARMRQAIFVSATPAQWEKDHAGQVVEQLVRPTGLVDPEVEVRPATRQVDDVLQEIRMRVERQERVLASLVERLAVLLASARGVIEVVDALHDDVDAFARAAATLTEGLSARARAVGVAEDARAVLAELEGALESLGGTLDEASIFASAVSERMAKTSSSDPDFQQSLDTLVKGALARRAATVAVERAAAIDTAIDTAGVFPTTGRR